jgi:hypothetical protein
MARVKPAKMDGYQEGLETIREALSVLAGGAQDIDYWRDAVRWLGRMANLVGERAFCLPALQLMFQVWTELGEYIKGDVIRAVLGISLVEMNVEVLEKVLWVLAETATKDDCSSPNMIDFIETVVDRIMRIGGSVRYELLPALIRLSARLPAERIDCFANLADMILKGPDPPGKVLWTLADAMGEIVAFELEHVDWSKLCLRLGQALMTTSSLKAKQHIALACNKIILQANCPIFLKDSIIDNLELCHVWLMRSDQPVDIDDGLYRKYYDSLLNELAKTNGHLGKSQRVVI